MPADLTLVMHRLADGESAAADELLEQVYEPLRVRAERQLRAFVCPTIVDRRDRSGARDPAPRGGSGPGDG